MQERADDINAELEMSSVPGQGTKVVLIVPTEDNPAMGVSVDESVNKKEADTSNAAICLRPQIAFSYWGQTTNLFEPIRGVCPRNSVAGMNRGLFYLGNRPLNSRVV